MGDRGDPSSRRGVGRGMSCVQQPLQRTTRAQMRSAAVVVSAVRTRNTRNDGSSSKGRSHLGG